MKKPALLLLMMAALCLGTTTRAEDPTPSDTSTSQSQAAPKAKKKKKKKKAAAAKAAADAKAQEAAKDDALANPDAVPSVSSGESPNKVDAVPPSLKAETKAEEAETTNARMKTEEGSKSPFSGQFNLNYFGSSLNHPFSALAPNPGNQSVPPVVYVAGTVSARYRLDKHTTMGVGTGLQAEQPLQGFKNPTVADPYFDIAKSFRWGKIQNRADAQVTLWTENQMHAEYGAGVGFTLSDEAFYETEFGLTVGFAMTIDANQFSGNAKYNPVAGNQVAYDIYAVPYFEYAISKVVSLRTVIGIAFEHNRALAGVADLYRPKVYQTLGLGISPSDWLFLYPYVHAVPYSGSMGVKTTTVGLSAIVNLF